MQGSFRISRCVGAMHGIVLSSALNTLLLYHNKKQSTLCVQCCVCVRVCAQLASQGHRLSPGCA